MLGGSAAGIIASSKVELLPLELKMGRGPKTSSTRRPKLNFTAPVMNE